MPNPILARADALMSRRRQTAENDDLPVLTDVVQESDDLTALAEPAPSPFLPPDHVSAQTAYQDDAPPLIEEVSPSAQPSEPTVEDVTREISQRIVRRLAAELPALVESAVRDYLAEQAMLAQQQDED